jgi:hypothetical protein
VDRDGVEDARHLPFRRCDGALRGLLERHVNEIVHAYPSSNATI